MEINKSLEVAYLPENTLDALDIRKLNEAYQFCIKHKVRSFCTHLNFIPYIESKNYVIRLVPVIDFPMGTKGLNHKLIDIGRAYESCKKASASEIDVVLNPETKRAIQEIAELNSACVNDFIGIKYIIELGVRFPSYIDEVVAYINNHPYSCKYLKTNTGRIPVSFENKLKLCKELRSKTTIPLKISGGVEESQISIYLEELGDNTIFGASYDKIKDWKMFNA